jgi:hypothetical protein
MSPAGQKTPIWLLLKVCPEEGTDPKLPRAHGNKKMHQRFAARATSISFVKRTFDKPLRVICRDGKVRKI